MLEWGEDQASPLRHWWFAVEAPEPSPAANFLEKLALSGGYVKVFSPVDRVIGTVSSTCRSAATASSERTSLGSASHCCAEAILPGRAAPLFR